MLSPFDPPARAKACCATLALVFHPSPSTPHKNAAALRGGRRVGCAAPPW